MTNEDKAAVLSAAFRQLSDALHLASVACKDLEYTIPQLAAGAPPSQPIPPTPQAQPVPAPKVKRVRDPNEPRRPPSAYLLFASEARAKLVKDKTDLKPAELMTKLGAMWSDLADSKKRVVFLSNVTNSSHMRKKQRSSSRLISRSERNMNWKIPLLRNADGKSPPLNRVKQTRDRCRVLPLVPVSMTQRPVFRRQQQQHLQRHLRRMQPRVQNDQNRIGRIKSGPRKGMQRRRRQESLRKDERVRENPNKLS